MRHMFSGREKKLAQLAKVLVAVSNCLARTKGLGLGFKGRRV